jgi:hypothetical protein
MGTLGRFEEDSLNHREAACEPAPAGGELGAQGDRDLARPAREQVGRSTEMNARPGPPHG